MSGFTYKDAGVDLDLNAQAMAKLPPLMRRTHSSNVLDVPGAFAGLFRLGGDYEDPVLVSGTDGVGTKVKVAILAHRYDTIGIDLVAMCANDVLCMGARPLFFLDYVALSKDDPPLLAELVEGISAGCLQAGAAPLGGETAVMPDLYAPGEFDLAGFCVGVVERNGTVDGTAIRPGDVLLGLASSGFHSNGYSLVRKVVFESSDLCVDDRVPELDRTVGDVLLEPTRIYVEPVTRVLDEHRAAVHGLAHVTGGGLRENLERLLPENCRAVVDRSAWNAPPEFAWLKQLGTIRRKEMFRVFNMGVGFVIVLPRDAVDDVRGILDETSIETMVVGEVVEGERGVEFAG